MARVTYFVVLTFERGEDGVAVPDEASEAASAAAAIRRAAHLASIKPAVVAFSRTGDPELGDFDDAVLLATHGDVPADVLEPLRYML